MVIESRKITKKCSKCNKVYEDEQILINGVPRCKYALCSECLMGACIVERRSRKFIEIEDK